jgi:molybdenum cofactor cytidylyltransferase
MSDAPSTSDAPAPTLPPTPRFAPVPLAPSTSAPPLKLGAIILAAGASSRLGQPKQLLPYEGRPLVTRAAEAALAAEASPVVVVLGAHAEKIRPALAPLPVVIAENPAWSEGMASSIRCGLTTLEASLAPTSAHSTACDSSSSSPSVAPTPPDVVLIALCDQPHFSANAIARLHSALATGVTIAATRHADGTGGVPAIFTSTHFPSLHALHGSQGARRIIAANPASTALVDLPELAFDIDTPADWQRLNSR